MPQHFAFRADAGQHIGNGHVMRCLTLADHLVARGHTAAFLCRDHVGQLAGEIARRGHAVEVLPLTEDRSYGSHPATPQHASLLDGDWRQDAAATRRWLGSERPDWLVVDHYGLDASWEEAACPDGVRLAVIDDLADRPHQAELLLDQNIGRTYADYDEFLPEGCTRLIGPRYALLRPEFAARRDAALSRRRSATTEKVLITMGGTDPENVTGAVLSVLDGDALPSEVTITVALGPKAPCANAVRSQVAGMSREIRIEQGSDDIAGLMADADLCIGAAGTTAWERCALGLPTVLVVLADNQRAGAEALAKAGAAELCSPPASPHFEESVKAALAKLMEKTVYLQAVEHAAAICNGEGCRNFETQLRAFDIDLRTAVSGDGHFVWRCRNDAEAWRNYRTARPTSLGDHLLWFESALKDQTKHLLIGADHDGDFGMVRLDLSDDGKEAEIGVGLVGTARGRGLGAALVARTVWFCRAEGIATLLANVRPSNTASRMAFLRCGFERAAEIDGFETFRLELR